MNGIRWLGSGSIIPLADGRYGMFFGAGNCLDNDSDGFHFIGYARDSQPVRQPSDLLNWKVVNGPRQSDPIHGHSHGCDYRSFATRGPYPLNPPLGEC